MDAPIPTTRTVTIAAEIAGRIRRGKRGVAAGRERTSPRRRSGAGGAAARSSFRTVSKLASDIAHHPLLELLERSAEPGGNGGRPDAEHACGGLTVQLQH